MTRALRIGLLFAGAVLAAATVTASRAADAAPRSDAPPEPAPAACLAALDELSRDIPRDESGPALRSMGLRIRTPIVVPDGVITERDVISGARVRVMIDSKGDVIPNSVTVQRATGDPKLALALSQAVPASLSFDVSGAFKAPPRFAFTTVYIVCAGSK